MRHQVLFFCLLFLSPACDQSDNPVLNEVAMKAQTIMVGTYTRKEGHVDGAADGIQVYSMSKEGKLRLIHSKSGIINPSYLAIDEHKKYLYAISETVEDERDSIPDVVAYRINSNKDLEEINRVSARGGAPCYISVDTENNVVLIANYVGGNFVAIPINPNGGLSADYFDFKVEDSGLTNRQKEPHAHFIQAHRNGYIYGADLGTDQIVVLKMEDSLTVVHAYSLPPGSGPRHLAFHPDKPLLYCINEFSGDIDVSKIHADGSLHSIQKISCVDSTIQGNPASADIVISTNGKYLYASNRGDFNSIAAFSIEDGGTLELINYYPSGGDGPRGIALSPDQKFLLVAHQNTNNISVHKVESNSGILVKDTIYNHALTPVCLKFL